MARCHRPLRLRLRRGGVRPDLWRERHPPSAHRTPLTDHDGQGGTFHKTLKREFLDGKVFDSIEQAQGDLDAWVELYNHDRPHQGIGGVAPWERFHLAQPTPHQAVVEPDVDTTTAAVPSTPPGGWEGGLISFAAATASRTKGQPWYGGPPRHAGLGLGHCPSVTRKSTRRATCASPDAAIGLATPTDDVRCRWLW